MSDEQAGPLVTTPPPSFVTTMAVPGSSRLNRRLDNCKYYRIHHATLGCLTVVPNDRGQLVQVGFSPPAKAVTKATTWQYQTQHGWDCFHNMETYTYLQRERRTQPTTGNHPILHLFLGDNHAGQRDYVIMVPSSAGDVHGFVIRFMRIVDSPSNPSRFAAKYELWSVGIENGRLVGGDNVGPALWSFEELANPSEGVYF